jgi:hypothetical protein
MMQVSYVESWPFYKMANASKTFINFLVPCMHFHWRVTCMHLLFHITNVFSQTLCWVFWCFWPFLTLYYFTFTGSVRMVHNDVYILYRQIHKINDVTKRYQNGRKVICWKEHWHAVRTMATFAIVEIFCSSNLRLTANCRNCCEDLRTAIWKHFAKKLKSSGNKAELIGHLVDKWRSDVCLQELPTSSNRATLSKAFSEVYRTWERIWPSLRISICYTFSIIWWNRVIIRLTSKAWRRTNLWRPINILMIIW